MATPLDRIRAEAGVTVPGSVPKPGSAVSAARRQDVAATRRPQRSPAGSDVDSLLRARRGAPVDLTGLRLAGSVVGLLAAVVATTHGWLLSWVAGRAESDGVFVYDWMSAILTVSQVHRWGPIVAALAAGALLVLAVTTSGFNRGYAAQSIGTAVAIVAGATVSIPWILAVLFGLLALLAYVLFVVALVVVAGMVLWQILVAAFE